MSPIQPVRCVTPQSVCTGGCRKRRLIVELDGGEHAQSLEDRRRDCALRALGYRVIRIWNNDVIENLDGVLQNLLSELDK